MKKKKAETCECGHKLTRYKWKLDRKVGEICGHCPKCDRNLALKGRKNGHVS